MEFYHAFILISLVCIGVTGKRNRGVENFKDWKRNKIGGVNGRTKPVSGREANDDDGAKLRAPTIYGHFGFDPHGSRGNQLGKYSSNVDANLPEFDGPAPSMDFKTAPSRDALPDRVMNNRQQQAPIFHADGMMQSNNQGSSNRPSDIYRSIYGSPMGHLNNGLDMQAQNGQLPSYYSSGLGRLENSGAFFRRPGVPYPNQLMNYLTSWSTPGLERFPGGSSPWGSLVPTPGSPIPSNSYFNPRGLVGSLIRGQCPPGFGILPGNMYQPQCLPGCTNRETVPAPYYPKPHGLMLGAYTGTEKALVSNP